MAEWVILLNTKIIKRFFINDGEKITIGRGKEADIIIDNTAISRQHISLEATINGIHLLSDLGSKNGTFVNGKKIDINEPISDKAKIEFGKFLLMPANDANDYSPVTDSVSADFMDLEEETIFVTSGQDIPAKATKKTKLASSPINLTLIAGKSTPPQINLVGKNSIKIGKDPSCDMVIPSFFVAKAQCYILKREDNYIVSPQKSWVGTFVNDVKITKEHSLKKGDIIKIRKTSIQFEL